MATVQDVARQVLAAIDTTAGHLLCCQWVAQRYVQLCSRARFRHLRRVGQAVIPAPIVTGTVEVIQGDALVLASLDAADAWGALGDLTGWHFRTTTNWYRVESLTGGTALRLAAPYTEASNPVSSYQLVRRYVPLSRDTRWLTQDGFVLQRTWTPLRPQPLAALDYQAPSRPLVGPWPLTWTQVESLADGTIQIEFYPMSTQLETVHYVYWAIPPELAMDAEVPSTIDAGVLMEGALQDAMRYNAARAANAGNIEAAGYWRNEYRAQNLIWERRILEAIRTDRGVDDVTLILQLQNAYFGVPQDLMTARDHIWYGWRP